jgi:vacuolar protein sorting-associated protein 16
VLCFAATGGAREQYRLLQDADKLARKFRLSEKRFCHIKVQAFVKTDQWANLRSLAEKRSPIGYKPFARAAINAKRPPEEILKFIRSISVPEERYDLLCEASMWKEALQLAVEMKDVRRLLNVKTRCNDDVLVNKANEEMAKLA